MGSFYGDYLQLKHSVRCAGVSGHWYVACQLHFEDRGFLVSDRGVTVLVRAARAFFDERNESLAAAGKSVSDSTQARDEHITHDPMVMNAVRSSADLLHAVLEQLAEVQLLIGPSACGDQETGLEASDAPGLRAGDSEWKMQDARLRQKIQRLESENAELHSQNQELATKIATSKIQETTPENSLESGEMFSWEERKRLILLQMEEDSFDANQFAASLGNEIELGKETPEAFIDRLRLEIEHRDEEIAELRHLLDQQTETRSDGTAIGASAIADMFDTNELIAQERGKLQQLQVEWEEKFRAGEIEASLERAKLSRERQEVLAKKQELELQLEQLQREHRQTTAVDASSSRRWWAKLGLAQEEF